MRVLRLVDLLHVHGEARPVDVEGLEVGNTPELCRRRALDDFGATV